MGLHYCSALKYHLNGTAQFDHPTLSVTGPLAPTVTALANGVKAAALYDTAIRADVEMPPIAYLSYVGGLGSRWEVMADLQWTGWSTIETLRFDLGAAYTFSKKANIDAEGGAAAGLLSAQYNSHTVIVSAQATWAF